jgi:hypothetical protein
MVSTRAGVYGAKKPVPDPRLIEKLKVTYKGKLIETNDDHLWIDALI